MIDVKDFYKLRLKKYLNKQQIDKVYAFEYLDRLWIGDTHYFTEWLRPINKPFATKSISLEIENIPDTVLIKIFADLDIPITRNSSKIEIDNILGKPYEVQEFANDRKTFNYKTPCKNYFITATFLNEGSFVYFTMNTSDISL